MICSKLIIESILVIKKTQCKASIRILHMNSHNPLLYHLSIYLPSGSQNPTGGKAPASFSKDIFIVREEEEAAVIVIGRNAVTHTADKINTITTLTIMMMMISTVCSD